VKAQRAVEAALRKSDQAELMVMQKQWFEQELALREGKGDSWAQFGAMKAATMRMVSEAGAYTRSEFSPT
jgi:hypothetical protein